MKIDSFEQACELTGRNPQILPGTEGLNPEDAKAVIALYKLIVKQMPQIEYVLSTHANRSVTKAAEACCVKQPTISMQIQNLEKELGQKIFFRSKWQMMKLTPFGELFIVQAKCVMEEFRILKLIGHDAK